VKTDITGNKQWEETYHGDQYSYAVGAAFQQTSDGGFILLGTSVGFDEGWPPTVLMLTKVDASGKKQWRKYFFRNPDDFSYDIKITPDGGYLLVGCSGTWSSNLQAWIIKTDAAGNKLWDIAWGGTGSESGQGCALSNDGGYLVVGSTSSSGAGGNDGFLLKLNASGQEQWYKTFGTTCDDYFSKVYQRPNGNIVCIGSTADLTGHYNVWVVETDANGNKLATQTFGGNGNDYGYDLAKISDGYALIGATDSIGAGKMDVYFIVSSSLTPSSPSITGSVKTSSGAGISDVSISFSSSGGTATTDGTGNYSITVPNGYTGTATPSKTGYTFDPASKTYSNVTANKTGEDYTGNLMPTPTPTPTPTPSPILAATFAGSGLWTYNLDSAMWTLISSVNPENMIFSGSTLYVDFGASGLYKFDGTAWTQLTSSNSKNMVASGSVLYVDFGASYGLYKWNGAAWTQLTPVDPKNMVASDTALYVDFGAPHGLFKWNDTAWSGLTSTSPENMVASGSVICVDFGASYGLQKWDGAAWSQLTSSNPDKIAISN